MEALKRKVFSRRYSMKEGDSMSFLLMYWHLGLKAYCRQALFRAQAHGLLSMHTAISYLFPFATSANALALFSVFMYRHFQHLTNQTIPIIHTPNPSHSPFPPSQHPPHPPHPPPPPPHLPTPPTNLSSLPSGLPQLRRSRRRNPKASAERIRRSRETWLDGRQAG